MNFWRNLSRYKFLLAAALFFLVGACNNDDDANQLMPIETIEGQLERIAIYLEENEIEAEKHEDGFYFIKTVESNAGTLIFRNGIVALQYSIEVLDGSLLENTYDQEPRRMQVGVNAILPTGLDLALTSFRVGEEGILYLPADLAFQSFSNNDIPKFAAIKIEFKVINLLVYDDIKQQELMTFENFIMDNYLDSLSLHPVDSVRKLGNHIFYKTTRFGLAKPMDTTRLMVNYRLSAFQGSMIREESIEMTFSEKNQFFSGFEIALDNMYINEAAYFMISSDYGYVASVFVMPSSLKDDMEKVLRVPRYAVEVNPFTPLLLELEIVNL